MINRKMFWMISLMFSFFIFLPFSFATVDLDRDFFLEVSRGNIDGYTFDHKFGRNPDIDTGTFEAIWNGGGDYTGFDATEAQLLEVFSTDVDDNFNGTGARTMLLLGLDGDFLEINETVELNGTNHINTTQQFIRMHRAIVIKSGTSQVNEGDITVRQSITNANIYAFMPSGYGQTMIAAFTIPANKQGFITSWFVTLSKKQAGFSNARFIFRPFNKTFNVNEEVTISTTGTSYVTRPFKIPKNGITGKTDIKIIADSSVNDMGIAAGFDIILIDIDLIETSQAEVNRMLTAIILILVLGFTLLIVGLWQEDWNLIFSSGFLFSVIAIYIFMNGLPNFNNWVSDSLAIILIGFGAYLLFKASVASLNEASG